MLSRRRFLAAGGALGAGGLAAGCGGRAADVLGLRRAVRVAVSWSATELQAFRAVLAGLGPRPYGIDPVSLGDDIETALGPTSGRYGPRPDIVLLPRPGLVATHQSYLAPLPTTLAEHWPYPRIWDLLWFPDRGGQPWGLPFKLAHKSLVWYRRDALAGHAVPQTWSDWLALNQALAAAGTPPLALPAGDGWTLTDVFENVLLGCAPDTYHRLEAGERGLWTQPRVEQAFRLLGGLWGQPGALAGGVERSLTQQFPDAVVEVFGHRRAAMVVAADYTELVLRQFAIDRDQVGVFPFPRVDGGPGDPVAAPGQPLLVGGDVAVLSASAGDDARDLLQALAAPGAPAPWIRGYGGFMAAHPDTPDRHFYPALDPLGEQLARRLAGGGGPTGFDLSDQLGALGGADGLWQVLQDLLTRVAARGPAEAPAAARDAAAAMDSLERQLAGGG